MDGDGPGLNWSQLITRSALNSATRDAAASHHHSDPTNPVITSITEDSRSVTPGTCFVAVKGTQVDGHDYINNAIEQGAAAIVCERRADEQTTTSDLPVLKIASTRGAASKLAVALFGLDETLTSGRMQLAGITGTNGKSTFCYLLRDILQHAGRATAMLGTIQYDLLSRTIEASMTTPPAAVVAEYLAEAADAGATHAVMEVSSHALDQGRCAGLRFAVGVFSNLTGDHLDYHGDMAAYLQAKKRLFDGLDEDAIAVINGEDAHSDKIVADCRAKVWRFGLSSGAGNITAHVNAITAQGSQFDLCFEGRQVPVDLPLIGRHNIQNALAAGGAALALGVELEQVATGLASVRQVPGRLERVTKADHPFAVLVDYAHTDDALANVLSALRPLTKGRLIVLFGCGGDRDRTKRPRMAAEAARWADEIIVTNDNPRTEDPQQIIADIMAGFAPQQNATVHVELDRREAIQHAISHAAEGDVVLLAGKGHENYQIVGTEKLAFDDAAVAMKMVLKHTTEGHQPIEA